MRKSILLIALLNLFYNGNAQCWQSVSAGIYTTLGIKTDGTLWACGVNWNGQLGDGTTTDKNYFVQVGTNTNWKMVSAGESHTLAIKMDGTLWAWGSNNNGQLGLGNTTNYSSPKQVGSLTNWLQISANYTHISAVKTDGTLWSWGINIYNGNLGLGDTTNRSSPVQVGALTTWVKIEGGNAGYHVCAIKTDGTLWSWGNNLFGKLGLGNTTYYSSPKQVGALTNWLKVAAGYGHTLAIG